MLICHMHRDEWSTVLPYSTQHDTWHDVHESGRVVVHATSSCVYDVPVSQYEREGGRHEQQHDVRDERTRRPARI